MIRNFLKRLKREKNEIFHTCEKLGDDISSPSDLNSSNVGKPNIVGGSGAQFYAASSHQPIYYANIKNSTITPTVRVTKVISKQKALEYIEMIEKKLVKLKKLRQTKYGGDYESLTISISTLEMTCDLVKQVFIWNLDEFIDR